MMLHPRGPSDIGWPLSGSDKAEPGLNPDTPPNSKKAPAIFSGHYAEVDTFFKEFALMANTYNLTNDN